MARARASTGSRSRLVAVEPREITRTIFSVRLSVWRCAGCWGRGLGVIVVEPFAPLSRRAGSRRKDGLGPATELGREVLMRGLVGNPRRRISGGPGPGTQRAR